MRSYWQQFDRDDLDDWQGIRRCQPDDDEDDWDPDDDDTEPEDQYGCTCGYYCMDCLGLNWRDFM